MQSRPPIALCYQELLSHSAALTSSLPPSLLLLLEHFLAEENILNISIKASLHNINRQRCFFLETMQDFTAKIDLAH